MHLAAKRGFVPERSGFCNRATMIANGLLPDLSTVLTNQSKVLVAWMWQCFAIAMTPNLRILTRWNGCGYALLFNHFVAVHLVVGTVSRDLVNVSLCTFYEVFENSPIMDIIRCRQSR